jgi:hypothetical protein
MQDNKKELEIFDFVPLTRYIRIILEVYIRREHFRCEIGKKLFVLLKAPDTVQYPTVSKSDGILILLSRYQMLQCVSILSYTLSEVTSLI